MFIKTARKNELADRAFVLSEQCREIVCDDSTEVLQIGSSSWQHSTNLTVADCQERFGFDWREYYDTPQDALRAVGYSTITGEDQRDEQLIMASHGQTLMLMASAKCLEMYGSGVDIYGDPVPSAEQGDD